jgi:acetyltransferase-like isoleucine patch superfamily enzyme
MINRFYNYLLDLFLLRTNPQKFAKKVGVKVKGQIHIYGGSRGMFGSEPFMIEIGNNVHITGECQFLTHDGSTLIFRKKVPTLEITKPISIGDDVFIGFRTIIMPGVKIGNNVVIGAGSVVTKDIPDNSLAVGNPCKVIKSSDELLEKLKSISLGFGHLTGKDKEKEIRKLFNK